MPYTHLSLCLSSLVWSTSTSQRKSVSCTAGVHDLLQVSLLYTFLIQLFESTVPSIEFFFTSHHLFCFSYSFFWGGRSVVVYLFISLFIFQINHSMPQTPQPVHGTATYKCDDTRDCILQFWSTDDEHMMLETCRGMK